MFLQLQLRHHHHHLLPKPVIHRNNRFSAQHSFLSSNFFPFTYSSPSPYSFSTTLSTSHTSHLCLRPSSTSVDSAVTTDDPPVRLVAIVGHGALSPLNSASWEQVMLHTVKFFHFHVVCDF